MPCEGWLVFLLDLTAFFKTFKCQSRQKNVKLVNQTPAPVRPTQPCPWHDSLRHQFWIVEIPVTRKLFAILDDLTPVARKLFTILDDDSSGNKFFLPAWTTRLRWQGSFSTSWMTCSAWQPVCRVFIWVIINKNNNNVKATFCVGHYRVRCVLSIYCIYMRAYWILERGKSKTTEL